MRGRNEILNEIQREIRKAPEEGQGMLITEYCLIEILIDIRDILVADMKTSLEISKAMGKRQQKPQA